MMVFISSVLLGTAFLWRTNIFKVKKKQVNSCDQQKIHEDFSENNIMALHTSGIFTAFNRNLWFKRTGLDLQIENDKRQLESCKDLEIKYEKVNGEEEAARIKNVTPF